MVYQLTSKKAIEYYNEHPNIDFDMVNELMVDMLERLDGVVGVKLTGDEIRGLVGGLQSRMDEYETRNKQWQNAVGKEFVNLRESYKFVNELMEKNKQIYLAEMRGVLEEKGAKSAEVIMGGIKKANDELFERTRKEIPSENQGLMRELEAQRKVFELETKKIGESIHEVGDIGKISRELDLKYEQFYGKLTESMYGLITKTNEGMITKITQQGDKIGGIHGMFQDYMEKQKNSTLKGKESEVKLEMILNQAYPHGSIKNNTGEGHAADYLLCREGKEGILFENKDYNTNVPDVEIKKFIRDIENKKSHGVILSQRSGIQNKRDYHIDIHMGFVIIYVHNVNYDVAKIHLAVQIIDHLVPQLKRLNEKQESSVSLELMSEINKEYLCFIGQKKQILENVKKFSKDMMRQVEEIEMPKLTCLLNSKFTNMEQLEFKCDICGSFTAKNRRALVTHQNSCRKKSNPATVANEVIVIGTN